MTTLARIGWSELISMRAMNRLVEAGWARAEILAACLALKGLLFASVDFDARKYAEKLAEGQQIGEQHKVTAERWGCLVQQIAEHPEMADAIESVMTAWPC